MLLEYSRNFCSEMNFCELHAESLLSCLRGLSWSFLVAWFCLHFLMRKETKKDMENLADLSKSLYL